MGMTFLAFIDCQLIKNEDWESTSGQYREDGVIRARKNHAEIHLVSLDGTFRQLFFAKNSAIRIVGNVIWFESEDSDYLITDHDKKLSNNKRNDS